MNLRFNVTLVRSTRKTSHMGSHAQVRAYPVKIGEDFGLNNLINWRVQFGSLLPEKIHKIFVLYEDGMTFGPFLGFKANESERGFTVISLSKNYFSMSFLRR